MKIILTLLLLIFTFQITFGQEYQYDEDNWLGEMGYPMDILRHIYPNKFYTKEDVAKSKDKLVLIKNSNKNEWEGYYQSWGELNQLGLIWDSKNGFIHYNIYTCNIELRGLGFGSVKNFQDSIKIKYEKPPSELSTKKNLNTIQKTLIKVKIGETHYLVPLNQLKYFCSYAVGREFGYSEQLGYWWKFEDKKKGSKGLPILPAQYQHLVVLPVDAKIVKLGKTIVKPSKNREDKIESGDVLHYVTISAGKDQNLEKEMNIYIPELDETATVKKVYSKTSIAIVYRDFYETRVERCWDDKDGKHEIVPCPEIEVGMSAITKSPFE